jgi:hypothetical protein
VNEYILEMNDLEVALFEEYGKLTHQDLPIGELVKQAAFEMMEDDIEGWRVWAEFEAEQAKEGVFYND